MFAPGQMATIQSSSRSPKALATASTVNSLLSPSSWKPAKRQLDRQRTIHQPIRWTHLKLTTRWLVLFTSFAIVICLWRFTSTTLFNHMQQRQQLNIQTIPHILQPSIAPDHSYRKKNKVDPAEWLRSAMPFQDTDTRSTTRPKAALISLVRNEELDGILQSMRQLEFHWNRRYRYPWMFFSETAFSEEFKSATRNATTSAISYHLIPRNHWSTPSWVNTTRYHDSLSYLHSISVGKGHLPSYRHMCRWNSGFFYQHPALASLEFYWRVEPDVHFFCDITYDPFRFLRDNDLVYGFNMNILDDARSFASLWRETRAFVERHPELVHPEADLEWLVDARDNAGEYNNCQFFSNFEIGSLDFFRGVGNTAYFRHLDEVAGGFFYERYGDAPIHTLSVALFAPKDKVWFFRDIGYQHDIARHCPADGVASGRCACEPTGLDENFYKLVPMESPQRKPADSCIRLWLGGEWLDKKDRWNQEVERLLGGDGYGGYVKDLVWN